jgi:hypothetical protein
MHAVLRAMLGCICLKLVLDYSTIFNVEVVMVNVHVGKDHKVLWYRAGHFGTLDFLRGWLAFVGVQSKFLLSSLFVSQIREEIGLAVQLFLLEVRLGLDISSLMVLLSFLWIQTVLEVPCLQKFAFGSLRILLFPILNGGVFGLWHRNAQFLAFIALKDLEVWLLYFAVTWVTRQTLGGR